MGKEFVLPPALEKGDKVAIVATSSGVQDFPKVLNKGVERLENRFGLEPVVYDTARKDTEYLDNHHEEKAEEFMAAFEDPEIKGVIALTGGSEQIRMLKHLEQERLKQNPTRFYGISDNTNLHIYLWNLGIQTFYGGQILDDLLAEGEIGEYTCEHLEKAFFEDSLGIVQPSEQFTDDYFNLFQDEIKDDRERYDNPGWEFWNFNEETVEGRLWGGCLTIIPEQMAVEKYLPEMEDLEGKILALETSEENPDALEVKRNLLCMGERGILQIFSAILVGRPMRSPLLGEDKNLEEKQEYHKEQKQTIKDEVQRYCPSTPVVFDVDFGHTHPKIPLPIGGEIRIDAKNKEIKLS
ncbi:MAG: peptidase U61 [Nanohaloarchaea archaeon SW_7_43_1]|nr:MAG: peptidase U61 [Nanohaloarchaea archaeon SW_7_43_1]